MHPGHYINSPTHSHILCYPQAKLYPRLLAAMRPGSTLGLSHGFLLGVMTNDAVDFRKDINVVLVAPKVSKMAGAAGWCSLPRADPPAWLVALHCSTVVPQHWASCQSPAPREQLLPPAVPAQLQLREKNLP